MTIKLKIEGDSSKEGGISILDHQAVTHPNTVKGEDVDVRTLDAATIVCFHAPVEAVPNTNPGKFLIQVSGVNSGDVDWATVAEHVANTGTPATENMNPIGSGHTTFTVASTAGFAAGDMLYLQDISDVVGGEWEQCKSIVVDASISIIDGLSTAKDTGDVAWNNAEVFITQLDLAAIVRVRVIFQHEGTAGANAHVKVLMTVGDRD